ncbi:MAG: hypothetical protein C4B59_16275, partial [Candidatus Methanogaster sp.]
GYCDRTIGIAIHCLPDDNTNTTIKDSIYFHFFELPSDLERIQKNILEMFNCKYLGMNSHLKSIGVKRM